MTLERLRDIYRALGARTLCFDPAAPASLSSKSWTSLLSTTSAEDASNGSRKATARSNGRGCHVGRSPRTPSVSRVSDAELLLRAVRKHVTCTWALLYIERWLTAPMVQEDETRIERSRGAPQGGVVSPILSNLFLHYAFDLWMTRTPPDLPWCRYADDGLVPCRTEQEAQALKADLRARLSLSLGTAPDENQDRLQQGRASQRKVSERQI